MSKQDILKKLLSLHSIIRRLKKQSQDQFDLLHELELEVALWSESLQKQEKKK
jgi:hypothetical protein